MKKIIHGRIFDTERAIKIGEASYGYAGDFSSWSAALYKTPRSGKFFLAGEGGPMTRWAQSVGQNEWSGGEDIIPLSPEDALEWAEENLETEEFEQHFADMIEEA